jgi:hypothetical protein
MDNIFKRIEKSIEDKSPSEAIYDKKLAAFIKSVKVPVLNEMMTNPASRRNIAAKKKVPIVKKPVAQPTAPTVKKPAVKPAIPAPTASTQKLKLSPEPAQKPKQKLTSPLLTPKSKQKSAPPAPAPTQKPKSAPTPSTPPAPAPAPTPAPAPVSPAPAPTQKLRLAPEPEPKPTSAPTPLPPSAAPTPKPGPWKPSAGSAPTTPMTPVKTVVPGKPAILPKGVNTSPRVPTLKIPDAYQMLNMAFNQFFLISARQLGIDPTGKKMVNVQTEMMNSKKLTEEQRDKIRKFGLGLGQILLKIKQITVESEAEKKKAKDKEEKKSQDAKDEKGRKAALTR